MIYENVCMQFVCKLSMHLFNALNTNDFYVCPVSLPDRGLTYKDSGVDIAAGNRLVDMIKPLAKATARAGNNITLTQFLSLLRSRLKPGYVSA